MENLLIAYIAGAGVTALYFCFTFLYYYYNCYVKVTWPDFFGIIFGTLGWPAFWIILILFKIWHWLLS